MRDLIEAIHDLMVLEFGEGLDEHDREIYESLSEQEVRVVLERLKLSQLEN